MSEATSSRPQVNGILETSLYVERPTRSVEFYRRVFGFEPIDSDQKEGITDQTRLCAMRAGRGARCALWHRHFHGARRRRCSRRLSPWKRRRRSARESKGNPYWGSYPLEIEVP
jgi:catechol 2,3-dioxygenase-like lactoylglutathione lyase family enzyme